MFGDSSPIAVKYLEEWAAQSAQVLANAPRWQKDEAARVHTYNVNCLEAGRRRETEIAFNAIVSAVAKTNGTSGDMAYGSTFAVRTNERVARRILQAVDCDYSVALVVAGIAR